MKSPPSNASLAAPVTDRPSQLSGLSDRLGCSHPAGCATEHEGTCRARRDATRTRLPRRVREQRRGQDEIGARVQQCGASLRGTGPRRDHRRKRETIDRRNCDAESPRQRQVIGQPCEPT